MYQLKPFILVIFLVSITACQTTKQADTEETIVLAPFPELDNSHFVFQSVPTPDKLFALNDEQKEQFIHYFYSDENKGIPKNKRLANYLFDKLYHFDFLGKTLTARQTLSSEAGNCLSLAILTKAFADIVGLETQYQRVNSPPIYYRKNNIMQTSGHVRTFVYAEKEPFEKNVITVSRPSVIIDYFPDPGNVSGEFVSEEDFISMFYQNLAGEAIISEEFDTAFSYLQEALKQNIYNPDTLNTLAVLNNRINDNTNTEKLYEFAVKNTQRTITLVSNYANFLKKDGEADKAKELLADVDANHDDNPYDWLDIGSQKLRDEDYQLALKYFRKALNLGPYLHEVHFGLAQVYIRQGKSAKAIEALEKANALTYDDPVKRLYTAKRSILQGSIK